MVMVEKFKVDMYAWNLVLHFMSFWNTCMSAVDFPVVFAEYFGYMLHFLISNEKIEEKHSWQKLWACYFEKKGKKIKLPVI